jgi:hypothetical protein
VPVPKVRDRVRLEGYDELFAVVHVNEREGWADLACLERVGFLTSVPLERIGPAKAAEGTPKFLKGSIDSL